MSNAYNRKEHVLQNSEEILMKANGKDTYTLTAIMFYATENNK